MRIIKRFCVLIFCLFAASQAAAQSADTRPLKIAVFASVYIDSAFTGNDTRFVSGNLPRYMLQGLDFYNGMMLAVDSLNAEHAPVEVLFFDTKSARESLEDLISKAEMQDVSLMIASFNNRNDIGPLAGFAASHQIPLISFTYPNAGDVTNNPYFVLINPTLLTHCEGLYKYLQRNYPVNNIVLFTRKGAAEKMITSTFNELNRNTVALPLKIKTAELPDSFTSKDITDQLDSTRQNVILCASLDETFGSNLVKSIGTLKNFKAVIAGMPTWDGLKDISKGVEIVYSTPYNYSRTDKTSLRLIEKYKLKFAGRASDMAFKGFESMYHFTKLLLKHRGALINNLSDKSYKIFNDFNIQPVYLTKKTATDYLENKKLYFIRKTDGQVKSVL